MSQNIHSSSEILHLVPKHPKSQSLSYNQSDPSQTKDRDAINIRDKFINLKSKCSYCA